MLDSEIDFAELRYLGRKDVASLLPSTLEQIDLVERTYLAMAEGRVELPPKPGIHPRADAFIHAMPAYLANEDVAAMKWVSGYPGNQGLGLPYISGLIIVNDAETGRPAAVMDAVEITAARTAAASGVCVRRWAPTGWERVGLIGAGEQGRYHARVLQALNPDAVLVAYDPSPERVSTLPGRAQAATGPEDAVRGAGVVITSAPIVKRPKPAVSASWLSDPCVVLPVDFDASLHRDLVESADLFLVDDVAQFEFYRAQGHFTGWPTPSANIGEALRRAGSSRRVVCCNLGVGALDAAFAGRVLASARAAGVGTLLSRGETDDRRESARHP